MESLINKRTFIIDSHQGQRIAGTDADFSFNVDIPTNESYDRVVLLNAKIPKSYYTIPAGFNTFILVENGVPATITLPPGCYNPTSFTNTVIPLLNAQSVANGNNWIYGMTISNGFTTPSDGKFTYTVTAPNNPSFIMPNFATKSTINEQFGFDQGSTNTFVGSTIKSTNVVSFQQVASLLVCTDMVDNGKDEVLQAVFTSSAPDYSIVKYQLQTNPNIASKKMKNTKSNVFQFRLCNEDYKLMDLNGQNVVYEIAVYKEQKSNLGIETTKLQTDPESKRIEDMTLRPQNFNPIKSNMFNLENPRDTSKEPPRKFEVQQPIAQTKPNQEQLIPQTINNQK